MKQSIIETLRDALKKAEEIEALKPDFSDTMDIARTLGRAIGLSPTIQLRSALNLLDECDVEWREK